MDRFGRKQLSRWCVALVAMLSIGCAGVYAEAGLSVLPTASYVSSDDSALADPIKPNPVDGGAVLNIGLGLDFDIQRKGRISGGYQFSAGGYGDKADGQLSMVAVRGDRTLANLSDNWKLRAGAGLAIGAGGSSSLPTVSGSELTRENITGVELLAGLGLAYYALPYLGVSFLVAPTYHMMQVPLGRIGGFGGTARLTASLTFGDSRPEAVIYEPMWSDRNVMPTIAAAARDVLCDAKESTHQSWAAVIITCPDDKREVMFFQTPKAVMITCQHSSETECRSRIREFIDASKNKLR